MTWKWLPYCVALAFIPAMVACEPEDTLEQDRQDDPPIAAPADPSPLMPNDHSGVTGTARADLSRDAVTITLSVEGLDPGVTYLASVHGDRCAADGPVRIPLGRVTGDDEGTARVDLRAEAHEMPERYPWSVQVQTEAGHTVACADFAEA